MADGRWLELRFEVPGSVAVLVEHRRAYQVFGSCSGSPQVVLAVGSTAKQQFLQKLLSDQNKGPDDGVSLKLLSSAVVIVDCEMHGARRLQRIEVRPARGDRVRHPLTSLYASASVGTHEFAYKLYWQVVAPFCTLIIFFYEDFDGVTQIMETLAQWAKLGPIQYAPRVIILYNDNQTHNPAEFGAQSRSQLARFLGTLSTNFESVRFLPTSNPKAVLFHANAAFELRNRSGFGLSGKHVAVLLQEAVRQFVQNRTSFNLIDASRIGNPLPDGLEDHIAAVVRATEHSHINHTNFIASALVFNAYPTGTHFFPPHEVFDRFYRKPLAAAAASLNREAMSDGVRASFIEIANKEQRTLGPGAHLQLIGKLRESWRDCSSSDTCFVCAVQSATVTISCRHRLCESCIIICGSSPSSDPWRYQISRCPLCHKLDGRTVLLKPPTAGLRVLSLGGTIDGRYTLLRFLKELQSYVGLTELPLREHFDLVIGSDIGTFFIRTIFLERWTLKDCRYHMKNLQKPRFHQKSSTVTFGKGQEWDFSSTRLFNNPSAVLRVKNHIFTNTVNAEELINSIELLRCSDIVVQYQGDIYKSDLLKSIGSRLFSYLFYVELLARPRFYTAPEWIHFRLCCRLPSGPPLMDLISRLYRENTRVRYRADEEQYLIESMVPRDALNRCREGGAFSRILGVKAYSMRSSLDVRIDGVAFKNESVSNCPYELQKLVEDQGLHCVFGRKDYRDIGYNIEIPIDEAFDEIAKLQQTLDETLNWID